MILKVFNCQKWAKQKQKLHFPPTPLTQDLLWTELDEWCLVCHQFQVPDGPLTETFMVQVKVTQFKISSKQCSLHVSCIYPQFTLGSW
jgi:hypothetical protein